MGYGLTKEERGWLAASSCGSHCPNSLRDEVTPGLDDEQPRTRGHRPNQYRMHSYSILASIMDVAPGLVGWVACGPTVGAVASTAKDVRAVQ